MTIFVIEGRVDRAHFERAFQATIDRTDVLRATIHDSEGGAELRIHDRFAYSPGYVDLSKAVQPDRALEEWVRERAGGVFDLSRRWYDAALIRLGDDRHAWCLVQHHVMADATSMAILFRRVADLYARSLEGTIDSVDHFPHFLDYVAFERQYLRSPEWPEAAAYWTRKVEVPSEPVAFYGVSHDPLLGSKSQVRVRHDLGSDRSRLIRALAGEPGVRLLSEDLSIFSVFAAVLFAYLHRVAGNERIVIGVPWQNRRHRFKDTMGLLMEQDPFAITIDADDTFTSLIRKVQGESLEVLRHLPYAAGNPGGALYNVTLNYLNVALGDFAGMHVTPHWLRSGVGEGSMALQVHDLEGTGSLVCEFDFSCDVFSPRQRHLAIRHFERLLDACLEDSSRRVLHVDILDDEERVLLNHWNDTARPYPASETLHQLIREQVVRTPEACAVSFGEQQLTYRELDTRANQVAHALQRSGAGPDVLVGACMERSIEMVVALLGILKAGSAYVPLDPAYPRDRLHFMIDDAKVQVLLTQERLLERLPAMHASTICVDRDRLLLEAQSTQEPATDVHPDNLAYMIYTSGSTGKPKGALNSHKAICNRLLWMQEQYRLGAEDAVLQKTPFSFDVSVWEFFWPLMTGARLVVSNPDGHRDPAYLARTIVSEQVTVAHFVPSMLRAFLAEPTARECRSLRDVICSGEALPFDLQREFFGLLEARLHNLYGPTEAAVDVTFYECRRDGELEIVPIGRPVANTQIHILDARLQPVPIGVPGELHIGGVQVGRGYHNRPELTAERFVRNPSSAHCEGRLYKTGDLARFLPDGNIEYLGRLDHQVKIRGFRIELGEIEAVLAGCPGVAQAVVLARENPTGGAALTAYIVPQPGKSAAEAALRERLREVLPGYMVPQYFVEIEALPLMPNGKLDRKALPAPAWSAKGALQAEPLRGPTEQALATIWSEVLGIPGVGRHDNFFELGGHSLLVVSMVHAALRRNLNISVGKVFTHPTIATLAASIPAELNEPAALAVQAIQGSLIPRDCATITPAMLPLVELSQPDIDRIIAVVPGSAANIKDIYPLAPLQEGIFYHHQRDTAGDTYLLRSIYAFDSRARLDAFLEALQLVIDRHDSLRTAVLSAGLHQPVQVVYREACLSVKWLADDTAVSVMEALQRETDPAHLRQTLSQAPLMWAYAAQERHGEACYLALVHHHIVADHTSVDLQAEEIRHILEGRGETLHEPVQFRTFIARVRGVTQERHEAYFRRLLGDLSEPTLPFDLFDTHVDQRQIRESESSLSSGLAERIRRVAASRGVSAAALFHAAWGMVLARSSGRDDVVFGTVLLGRSRGLQGIDRVMGLCMNTLPVRLRLGTASATAIVADIHRQLGELLEHEQADLVVAQRCSAVAPPAPLFSALLNYRHSPADSIQDHAIGSTCWLPGIRRLLRQERTNYPVYVSVDDVGTGFHVGAQCVVGIDPQRLVSYLTVALETLADALEQNSREAVRSLNLLPEAERELLHGTWNATSTLYPDDRNVTQLFEEQVGRCPDALAVTYADESLSYRELNARANALATHLQTLGVGPGVLVGLFVERSLQMMVGLLATLKAGGTYVPLDPAFPTQRLAFMLEDSQASVLLTQTGLAGLLPVDHVHVVDLNRLELDHLAGVEDLPPAAGPDDLAYVLYTSGSTGKPKGVEIPHRALTNFLCAMRSQPGCDEHDVLLAVTTLSFDIAGLELYLPLISGACVELASREEAADGRLLRERIERVKPTLLQATPATWRMLIEAGWQGSPQLSALIGGEALPPDLVAPLLERTKALWNLYGPTETTIWSSVKQVTSASEPITVGRPIANTTFYIVDKALQPVPTGVAGELLIGGDGLARGYRGRPELTAEKFIAHPFSDEPGARVYRTGDLARYRADGEVVHLGRMDQQVKVRGFRIELGEIEAALGACAGVGQAVVDARADHTGTAVLAAYVVPAGGQAIAPTDLRQALRQTLPEYMVPQYFVQLEALPLTPNGKIDRKALPAPEAGAIGQAQEYIEPRTPTEIEVAAIVGELLGVQRVGAQADFFELGGHSLLAIRLMSRLGARFKVELPLQTLFEASTVRGLSDSICALTGAERADQSDEGTPSSRGGASRPATLRRLLTVWERVLGTSGIGVEESFLTLQGSRDLVEPMLREVRREFGVFAEGLPLKRFLAEPTIRALAEIIDDGIDKSDSLMVCLQRSGSKVPLFLVHAGGGYVFFYRAFAERMGRQRPIYAIRAATRTDNGGPPFDRSASVEMLAARYIEELKTVQPQGPYALGGACFGGVIAFEMARQLLARGEQLTGPILLFDAFVVAPEEAGEYAGTGGEYAMNRVAAHLARSSGLRSLEAARYLAVKVLKNLPTAFAAVPPLLRRAHCRLRQSDAGIEATRRVGTVFGVSSLVEEAQKRTMQRFLDATFRLLRSYRPGVLDGAIVLFRAADGPDPAAGWNGLARGGIVVHEMPGVHLDMMEEPAVAETASLVARYLDGLGKQAASVPPTVRAMGENTARSIDSVMLPQPFLDT